MTGDEMNTLLRERYADYEDSTPDPHGHGKRVPYIGSFWQDVDFDHNRLWIGNCGSCIGLMQNNKWGYNERMLTEDEAVFVKETLLSAFTQEGETQEQTFRDLWDWFQQLLDCELFIYE